MWPSHIAKPLQRAPVKRSCPAPRCVSSAICSLRRERLFSMTSAATGERDLGRSPPSFLVAFLLRFQCGGRRGPGPPLHGRPARRHGMFRMPDWMSEDDDMSDLAHRMSHAPHFATMGRRGGPWRERRSSGGSAMSATSEDDFLRRAATDKSSQCSGGSTEGPATSHEIPIRLEAPAPPSASRQQQQQVENEPVAPLRTSHARNAPQYPVRTTSAVDASDHSRDVPRSTRWPRHPAGEARVAAPRQVQHDSQAIRPSEQNADTDGPQEQQQQPFEEQQQHGHMASPQMQYQQPPQPQQVPSQTTPQYQQQYQQQQPQFHQQYHQQQPQYQQQYHQQQPQYQQQYHQTPLQQQQQSPRQSGQRPSVVRNIPIFVEGRDGPLIESVKASVDEYRAKLDNVDPDGRDDVRQARRAVIKDINAAISLLESKAAEPEQAQKEKTPTPVATHEAAAEPKVDSEATEENRTTEEEKAAEQKTEENDVPALLGTARECQGASVALGYFGTMRAERSSGGWEVPKQWKARYITDLSADADLMSWLGRRLLLGIG
ncbi:hypothetical protein C7M84_020706 [Penaeus vannamei]|uniref:BAG domain-containing protein n=1 Tax=Penaeus vannamei TaxID=6689 RepID=A0A423SBB4_PENVA|nr:hypothetical protein C7M84_020706 [Penaeus vannamei]